MVKQPDYETEPVCVVTVNKPNSSVDQSEELLKKLLAVLTPTVPPPARAPELSPMEKLVQLLLSETVKREPAPPTPAEPPGLKTLLQTYFAEQESPQQGLRFRQARRNWSDVKCFSCGKTGHSATPCPTLDVTFPFILPGGKRRLIRREGFTSRISKNARPHDPGGGGGRLDTQPLRMLRRISGNRSWT